MQQDAKPSTDKASGRRFWIGIAAYTVVVAAAVAWVVARSLARAPAPVADPYATRGQPILAKVILKHANRKS